MRPLEKLIGAVNSLTTRLLLLAGLPLFTVTVIGFSIYRASLEPLITRDALSELQTTHRHQAELVGRWFRDHQLHVDLLASSPEARRWDVPEMLDEARRLTSLYPALTATVFADATGSVVVDSISGSGGSIANREYFQQAARGERVVTNLLRVRTSEFLSVIVARPVASPAGEILGIAFGVIRPDSISGAVQADVQGSRSATYVMDGNHVVASGQHAGNRAHNLPSRSDTIDGPYEGIDGVQVYGIRTQIPELDWYVVSEMPVAVLTNRFERYNASLVSTVAGALAIGLLVAVLTSLSIQIPVRQLREVSRRIAAADSSVRASVPPMRLAPTALKDLRATMLDMERAIHERQSQLEQSNRVLKSTQAIAHLGSWRIVGGVLSCSDELHRIVGLPADMPCSVGRAMRVIHPDDRAHVLRTIFGSARGDDRAAGFELEHRIVHATTGTVRYVVHRWKHIPDDFGAIIETQGSVHDVTDRHRFEVSLQKIADEKSFLLQEVHHRVRNNLSVIQSIVGLQRDLFAPESVEYRTLSPALSRIAAMTVLHRQLYETETLDRVDLADYIPALLGAIDQSYGRPEISLVHAVESVMTDIGTATSCGMLLNELIVNAYKHAFPQGHGTISVGIRSIHGSLVELNVADDGVGIGDTTWGPPERNGNLGATLIASLVQQLAGTLTRVPEPGTHFVIRFPSRSVERHQGS